MNVETAKLLVDHLLSAREMVLKMRSKVFLADEKTTAIYDLEFVIKALDRVIKKIESEEAETPNHENENELKHFHETLSKQPILIPDENKDPEKEYLKGVIVGHNDFIRRIRTDAFEFDS